MVFSGNFLVKKTNESITKTEEDGPVIVHNYFLKCTEDDKNVVVKISSQEELAMVPGDEFKLKVE